MGTVALVRGTMTATVRRQRPRRLACWALMAVLLADQLALSDTLAVMSVDLGSESMKVAIVKPGVPMEIVLISCCKLGSLLPRALPSRLAEVNMGGFPPTCTTLGGWSRQGESEQGNPATFPGSKPCENPVAPTCVLLGPGIPCGVASMGCQHPVSLLKICIFPVAWYSMSLQLSTPLSFLLFYLPRQPFPHPLAP
uniref:Hypoxia up-regulated 1 n=1 Tax=Rousettus aegyptiacus TaxID=9407 RepID=A0A7J8H002_ROUAE|nr:hypoxia up-regulated 1 [Rousettus aegyptiacus]